MFKLSSKLLILILAITMVVTGCSNAKENVTSTDEQNASHNNMEGNGEIPNQNGNQKRNNRPDMMGKVKSIIGNEIILQLAEMPEIQERSESEQNNEKRALGVNNNGSGFGGPPGGMRSGGNREMNFTGETKTLLIPVGVPITSFGAGGEKELEIEDIYEGSILQIWFDKDDNEMITQVRMMQGSV